MRKVSIFFMLVLFGFTSCSNQIQLSERTEEKDNMQYSIKQNAEKYISNMFIWDNINMGRSITSKQKWPNFLDKLSIKDINGVSISFNDLSDEEKEIFAKRWYESEVEILSKAMEKSEEIYQYVETENEIIEQSIGSISRSADYIKQSDEFMKSYLRLSKKQYKKTRKTEQQRSISGDSSVLTVGDLNFASADYLGRVYKQGYVFISDMSVSSGSFFGGHAALMSQAKWDDNWKRSPNERISISAWGDVGPNWEGKKANKVQTEPLVYWAGKADGCPQKVTIVKMKRKWWVWDWFNSGYRIEDASREDAAEAVANARDWLDRDYGYVALIAGIGNTVLNPLIDPALYAAAMAAKHSENQFYCSQLVWRAWYNVSSDFDIQPLKACILPEDFKEGLSGGVTEEVGSYQNY